MYVRKLRNERENNAEMSGHRIKLNQTKSSIICVYRFVTVECGWHRAKKTLTWLNCSWWWKHPQILSTIQLFIMADDWLLHLGIRWNFKRCALSWTEPHRGTAQRASKRKKTDCRLHLSCILFAVFVADWMQRHFFWTYMRHVNVEQHVNRFLDAKHNLFTMLYTY